MARIDAMLTRGTELPLSRNVPGELKIKVA